MPTQHRKLPSERYRCFVSSPVGFDLSPIKEVLQRIGVEPVSPSEAATDLVDATRRALVRSDFALFVHPERSPSVLVELGMALGLAKPTVLIRDSTDPLDLRLPLYGLVQLSAKDSGSLEPVVHQLTQLINKRRHAPQLSERSEHENVSYALQRPRASPGMRALPPARHPDQALEGYVKSLLALVPTLTTFEAPRSGFRQADFAIWSDKLNRVVGNPILVEAKSGSGTRAAIDAAVAQVSGFIDKSNARAAILVFESVPDMTPPIIPAGGGLVFVIDIHTFAELIARGVFEKRVAAVRNAWAHGGITRWQ